MVAQLQKLQLRSPGSLGLVTDQSGAVENPEWATKLLNCVINDSQQIESRQGWSMTTTSGNHGEDTEAVFEYVESSTSTRIISAANSKLYEGTATLSDVTGTATVTAGDDWQFVNYNGKVVGFQQGEQPIVKTAGGNFADVVAGTGSAPTGNAAIATHGRIFAFDSAMQTIKYCALLDETDWGGAGAGSLNMRNVWPIGLDVGVALAEWNNQLVIFGERSIVIYSGLEDPGTNLALGATSDTLGQEDMITGDGLVSRDAVVSTGTDLIYLSRSGLRSLKRGLFGQQLPFTSISPQIRRQIAIDVEEALGSSLPIRMVYHRPISAIIARIGSKYWYFDVRDADRVRASQWEGIGWLSAASVGSTLYLGQNDGVATYTGYDDNGSEYSFEWQSPWFAPMRNRLFIPKNASVYANAGLTYQVQMGWSWDYDPARTFETKPFDVGSAAEYGVAEYGIAEYGPVNRLYREIYNLSGAGELMQLSLGATINGGKLAIQQIDISGKAGRAGR